MKNIIKIAALGLLIVGCTEIEPLQMKVDAAEKNLTEIKNYKSTEHYISAVWFSNWKADGNMNSYLSTLPDSLDMVILENGYTELTEAQKTDLKCVREEKGMKVLMTVDLDKQYEQYLADLEEAEETGESIAEEQAASEGREVTMEDIENAVKHEQQRVKDKYSSIGDVILNDSEKIISESGLDGLTIRITSTADIFFRDIVKLFIEKAGERMNKSEKTIVLIMDSIISSSSMISTSSCLRATAASYSSVPGSYAEMTLSSCTNSSLRVVFRSARYVVK